MKAFSFISHKSFRIQNVDWCRISLTSRLFYANTILIILSMFNLNQIKEWRKISLTYHICDDFFLRSYSQNEHPSWLWWIAAALTIVGRRSGKSCAEISTNKKKKASNEINFSASSFVNCEWKRIFFYIFHSFFCCRLNVKVLLSVMRFKKDKNLQYIISLVDFHWDYNIMMLRYKTFDMWN